MAEKHICWNRSVLNVAGVCYNHPTKCQLKALKIVDIVQSYLAG